jgi:hypothetical protein
MRIATCALMILIALSISGCGKRARFLDPPEGSHEKYPKRYPPTDSPGTHL